MNTIWKGVLGVALVAAVGSGAAIGTSTYMMKHQQYAVSGDSISNVFSQPVRMVNYASVAAENTDFTVAAESAVHGVVHIMATQNASESSSSILIHLNISSVLVAVVVSSVRKHSLVWDQVLV